MIGSVIITGGGGFVGRHLIAEIQRAWPQAHVIVWDKNVERLPVGVSGVQVDIIDVVNVRAQVAESSPDWIVHLAAIASVPYSIEHPDLTRQVNVEGTMGLLRSVREVSPRTKVLIVSSADIYGISSTTAITELALDQCHPRNPYAVSKWEVEHIVEAEFNDMCIRVRPFPHIGPGQALGFVTADFASQIAAIEAGQQSSVIKVGNLEAKRDFTDVRDVVRAYRLLLEKGVTGEVYNVASGQAHTINDLLRQLLAHSATSITVEQDPARVRKGDDSFVIGDASKVIAATGWQPMISFDESLRDVLNYWRKERTS